MAENPETTPWDEARRRDLADSAAVIVALPDSFHPYSDQRQMDLGQWRYDFAWGEEYADERQRFQQEFVVAVQQAAAHIPSGHLNDRLQSRPYEIGPAAQGWPLYLVQFVNDVRPLLEDALLVWSWAKRSRRS